MPEQCFFCAKSRLAEGKRESKCIHAHGGKIGCMKKSSDRKWICVIPVTAAAGTAALVWKFFRFAVCRGGTAMPGRKKPDSETDEKKIWGKYWPEHTEHKEWLVSRDMDTVSVMSEDGLKLFGRYFACEKPERIVLCVHGYRGAPLDMFADSSRWFHENNCDLLLIESRSSGRSEGKYITFGAKEKRDIVSWCRWIEERNEGRLPVYLYGISMGAAAVLLSCDQGLPSSVKGIIADCGFSSVRKTFEDRARESFHLPPYPMLYLMEAYCRVLADFRFEDADAVKALEHNTIPVLFFHGEEDHFVRPENTLRNFEADAGKKELVVVPGAAHAASFIQNPRLYTENVRRFFERCEEKKNRE